MKRDLPKMVFIADKDIVTTKEWCTASTGIKYRLTVKCVLPTLKCLVVVDDEFAKMLGHKDRSSLMAKNGFTHEMNVVLCVNAEGKFCVMLSDTLLQTQGLDIAISSKIK